MAERKPYSEIKAKTLRVGEKQYYLGKKTYANVKDELQGKKLDLNVLGGFISKDIGIDTLSSDITSLNDNINQGYSSWQKPGWVRSVRGDIGSMQKRLDALDNFAAITGNEELSKEIGNTRTSYFQASDNLRKLGEVYGNFENAKHYGIAQMSLEEIEPHLKDDNKVAYTTKDGQNLTWQALYDTKKYEQEQEQHFKELSSKSDFKEKSKYKSTKGSYKNW